MRVLIAHSKQERVDKGIETDGSNLSGVSAKCAWDDLSRPPEDEDDSRSICIGSQPRRLSDKGEECKGQAQSDQFKNKTPNPACFRDVVLPQVTISLYQVNVCCSYRH